jgi:hypothetical protein
MNIVTDEDRETIERLSQKYGSNAVISIASKLIPPAKIGRPADPSHNCASVWAFIEFLKNYRVAEQRKKFENALAMGEEILARVTPRDEPFTLNALRNLYYEAKRRRAEPVISELMDRTYAHFVDVAGARPKHIVPLPLLPRGVDFVMPAIDTEMLDLSRRD